MYLRSYLYFKLLTLHMLQDGQQPYWFLMWVARSNGNCSCQQFFALKMFRNNILKRSYEVIVLYLLSKSLLFIRKLGKIHLASFLTYFSPSTEFSLCHINFCCGRSTAIYLWNATDFCGPQFPHCGACFSINSQFTRHSGTPTPTKFILCTYI